MGYLKKLGICLLTGVTVVIVLQRIGYRLSWEWASHRYPPPVFTITGGVLILLAAIVASVVWQQKGDAGRERKGGADFLATPAVWQGVLAGFIGLDLATFGWQKLFHQQFVVPIGGLDEPFSSFSREDLTWAYFHASYAFTCVIGVCQIAGSFLLFFRRTRLFAAIFLLPVIINITLIDLFYGLEAFVTSHAIILLIGLFYLILVDYKRLAVFFFSREGFPRRLAGYAPPIALAIVLPVLLMLSFGSPDRNPQLTGKYRVEGLRVDGVGTVAASCQDSVLTTVIFDLNNDMVLEFNGLRRRWIGSYRFDRPTGDLVAFWRFPAQARDTLFARMSRDQSGAWQLTGSIGKDSLRALLVKCGPPAGLQR